MVGYTDDQVKEIAGKWSAALRSGEYPQTTGQLCRRNLDGKVLGYCCLGVLAVTMGLKISDHLGDDGIIIDGAGTSTVGNYGPLHPIVDGLEQDMSFFYNRNDAAKRESWPDLDGKEITGQWSFSMMADTIDKLVKRHFG